MPEKVMDDVMESAVGAHFSGLRLPSPSAPSSPSSASVGTRSNGAVYANGTVELASPSAIRQPFVIGVSGGTASGKTTVCDMIIQQLHDHRVMLVNQDDKVEIVVINKAGTRREYIDLRKD